MCSLMLRRRPRATLFPYTTLFRSEVRRAPPHHGAAERRAASRAGPVRAPPDMDEPSAGEAVEALDGGPDHGADRVEEPVAVLGTHVLDPPGRVDTGPPQGLVGQEVADAGQKPLIHERG